MARKGDNLFVGGLGKEWTTVTGELVNYFPQWVKVISYQGSVHHLPWKNNYNAMRQKAGYDYPGMHSLHSFYFHSSLTCVL